VGFQVSRLTAILLRPTKWVTNPNVLSIPPSLEVSLSGSPQLMRTRGSTSSTKELSEIDFL